MLGATAAAAASAPLLNACSSDDGTADADTEGTGGGGSSGNRSLKLGFIPLTDCAPLVIAKEKGFFERHDLDVTLENGKSWPEVRDKLLNGEFDGAHALFSLPFSVATGVSKIEGSSDLPRSMRVAMMLNNNGQAITLANDLAGAGYADLEAAKETILANGAKSFGQTFPGGTHDTWLRYWMKAAGLDWAAEGFDIKPIPPPDMFANLNQENVRGYCVGEPWNARAVIQDKGFTTIATQDIWQHHPEKALVVGERFATEREDVLRDVMLATLEAAQWADDPANVAEVATIIGVPKYVNATPDEIEARLGGVYEMGGGIGEMTFDEDRMRFFRDGLVNFPRKSYALWFMAQYVRFGHLPEFPSDAQALADEIILTDLYADVAAEAGVDVPADDMAPFDVKLDGATFDPEQPEEEAARP
jgi:nitrate/nitrite transport system substrate-binding protein